MALKLNETREAYREFYGRNVEQMPKLIAEGRVPMSVAGLMQRRLDVRNSDADIKGSYIDNYFDTSDAVVYHPDGRVKIVLDSQTLRDITPQSKLINGALVLTEDAYNALQGEEFKKGKLGKTKSPLSRKDVKAHPVWKVLAREQALLDDYVDYIFTEGKQRFSYDTAMGVYPSSAQGKTPDLKAWYVYWLGGRSYADGRILLDCGSGRFLGIAPEALSAPGKCASNIKAYTMADLQAVDKTMKGLETTVRPELLEPFAQLRKKL
ncbi:hypothetical protein AUJ62_01245 [Candidatus Pacearchaeota archaeon CG1_02_32_21]|nr:MAG: hypothetical protein AUJ62_01245 [Candidatus Pacearchaeota archaeon CG1_02_32_21]